MKFLLIAILSFQLVCFNSQVISRNGKIEEMMKKVEEAQVMFDQLIEEAEKKVTTDYDVCMSQMQKLNCSQLDIWQHERAKHSKNITNMQQKLKNHQQTIYKIMELNNEESKKKYLTIDRLIPKMIKIKNDIEFLDGMLFIIDDTYINVDDTEHSILEMFDSHFNPMEAKLIQLSQNHQQSEYFKHDPGAKAGQKDSLPHHPEEPKAEPPKKFNQGPPLIDEEIFDGQAPDYKITKDDKLFSEEGEPPLPAEPEADLIPEGVNVPEHDALEKSPDEMAAIMQKYKQQKEAERRQKEFEDLQIDELEKDFKDSVKALGGQMKDKIMELRQTLQNEFDTLAQSVADLEHSMIELHHRHAKQIVQIYIEMKHLQKMIFEKDDIVLRLDGSISDCSKKEEKTGTCNAVMSKTKEYTEQLKAQKEFNVALLKELNKLKSNFNDKNVETPVIDVTPPPDPEQEKKEARMQAQLERAKQEIEQIEAAEQEVAQSEDKQEIVTLDKTLIQKEKKNNVQKKLSEPDEVIEEIDEKDLIPQSSALIAAQLEEKLERKKMLKSKLKKKQK